MGQDTRLDPWWRTGRVELGVDGELSNRSEDLCQTADNDLGKKEGEEDLDREQSTQREPHIAPVDRHLDSQLAPSCTNGGDDNNHRDGNQVSVLHVDRPRLRLDLTTLLINLILADTRPGLLVIISLVVRRPDKLHQLRLDSLGALYEMERIIVPYSEQGLGRDKGSELMLPGSGEILHGGKDLDSQAIHQWYIDRIWRPGQESLDDSRVHSHDTLSYMSALSTPFSQRNHYLQGG